MTRSATLCALLLVTAAGFLFVAVAGPDARADGPAPAPTIEFLEGDAAKTAIGDESQEPYFSLLQTLEMTAKMKEPVEGADLDARREDCRRHYRDHVVGWTDEEKAAVKAVATRLTAAWATEYPALPRIPWSFIAVDDVVEAGLPHSRDAHIVLPQDAIHAFVRVAKRPKAEVALGLLGLLAHEQAHVLQRRMPDAFAALYASWGFVHATAVASAPWLDRQRATNPDGIDLRWVFPLKEGETTTWIQPLALLAEAPDGPPDFLRDMRIVAVTLDKKDDAFTPRMDGDKPAMRDLAGLAGYQELWGSVEETFHPNEIFANLFARLVLKDHFDGPDLDTPSTAAGKDLGTLRAWCREHFAAAPTPK